MHSRGSSHAFQFIPCAYNLYPELLAYILTVFYLLELSISKPHGISTDYIPHILNQSCPASPRQDDGLWPSNTTLSQKGLKKSLLLYTPSHSHLQRFSLIFWFSASRWIRVTETFLLHFAKGFKVGICPLISGFWASCLDGGKWWHCCFMSICKQRVWLPSLHRASVSLKESLSLLP